MLVFGFNLFRDNQIPKDLSGMVYHYLLGDQFHYLTHVFNITEQGFFDFEITECKLTVMDRLLSRRLAMDFLTI